jgi:hypothetical protein
MKKSTVGANLQVKQTGVHETSHKTLPLADTADPIRQSYIVGKKGSIETKSITNVQATETGK